MRLDHLLSKEQLAQAIVLQNTGYRVQSHISGERPGVASSLVEHWLFGLIVSQRQLVHLLAGGTLTAMAAWPSTLLGPEGTDVLWSALRLDRPLAERPRSRAIYARSLGRRANRGTRRSRARYRPYFENCIVDASIISVVAKLLRAHGGCLGTRSRRRT